MAGEQDRFDNTKRPRIDANSIKMTTISSFAIFAVVLIAIFWGLFNYFTNTYYQTLRTQEVIRTASALETQYREYRGECRNGKTRMFFACIGTGRIKPRGQRSLDLLPYGCGECLCP